MIDRIRDINARLDEILIPFSRGHPITYNHYFTETIQSIRQKRLEKNVAERLHKLSPGLNQQSGNISENISSDLKISDLITALSSCNDADMDKYAASEILICMEAYYKVNPKSQDVCLPSNQACRYTMQLKP